MAAVKLEDPAGDIVEKIAVVGNRDNSALVALEMLFQPIDGFGVEVIGRLIQEEDVGFLQQQTTQGDAAFFTAGEHLD